MQNPTKELRDLHDRYRRLKAETAKPEIDREAYPNGLAYEHRSIHQSYANIAWIHRSSEALLCGLALQLRDEVMEHVMPLRCMAANNLDRAAEQKVLASIERELVKGYNALATSDPELAWILPFMLRAASFMAAGGAAYFEELPSLARYLRYAELGWRVPADVTEKTFADIPPLDDWLRHEGYLFGLIRCFSPLRLGDVSFEGICHAYGGPERIISVGDEPPRTQKPSDPFETCHRIFQEIQGRYADPWATLSTKYGKCTGDDEALRPLFDSARAVFAAIDAQFSAILTDGSSPLELYVIDLSPDVHHFVAVELLPRREIIEGQLQPHPGNGNMYAQYSSQDDLLEYALTCLIDEAERRNRSLRGESYDSDFEPSVRGYRELLEEIQLSGFSLDKLRKRQRVIGPLILSERSYEIPRHVGRRLVEAYRAFLHGLFLATVAMARSAVEVAAKDVVLQQVKDEPPEIQRKWKDTANGMDLKDIVSQYFAVGGAKKTRMGALANAVRVRGNQALHTFLEAVEHPGQWNEQTTLPVLLAAKNFIEIAYSSPLGTDADQLRPPDRAP